MSKLLEGGGDGGEKLDDVEVVNLFNKLANVRKWYNLVDGELKSVNRLGFVEYRKIVKEAPILTTVISNFVETEGVTLPSEKVELLDLERKYKNKQITRRN